ncbi:GNAT family N-acetyltransferase [Tabrizicola sp.]|uniref:GNAT family N-acetyltransferase n=1 Tax=Tabrizicola sp. TaxID=2005166 RepID=UPI0027323C26|nr:GNAT family N-acetyltransferase [Tabrizicola sp.]MDP3195814.1 GNAT family N-acetyltransferase [Tabrizicola sp.]
MFDFGETGGFQAFQQSVPYAAAVTGCGGRVCWLDGVLAVERGPLRLVSRVGGQDRAGLRRLARWQGVTVVTPEAGVAGFGLVPLITPMHHAVWRLGPDLRAGMSGKWRNRLVAAERGGVRVRQGGQKCMEALLAAEGEQRRQRGYRALPEGFSRALPLGALRLWEWRQSGTFGAGMGFVVHGTSATYHLGWASDGAKASGVHGVMLMRAAEALRAEGVHWLDLGSVDAEAAPGLARFKLGTGADLRRLGATCLVLP